MLHGNHWAPYEMHFSFCAGQCRAHLSQNSSFCWFVDSFSTFLWILAALPIHFLCFSFQSLWGFLALLLLAQECALISNTRNQRAATARATGTATATATATSGCGLLKGQAQKPASISRFTFVVRCFKSAAASWFSTPCCCWIARV